MHKKVTVLGLCSGSQKYPVPHGSTAWSFCCNSWTMPAFCCHSFRSHSLQTEDMFSAWVLCWASRPPKLFLQMCGSSFCRSDSNVSFLVRFLWLHIENCSFSLILSNISSPCNDFRLSPCCSYLTAAELDFPLPYC